MTTIIQLSVFIPYRIGKIYLLIDFCRIGHYFIEVLKAELAINANCIKFILVFSFTYLVSAQLLNLVWWLYPAIKFFQDEDCSDEYSNKSLEQENFSIGNGIYTRPVKQQNKKRIIGRGIPEQISQNRQNNQSEQPRPVDLYMNGL